MKRLEILILMFLIPVLLYSNALALKTPTHEDINKNIAEGDVVINGGGSNFNLDNFLTQRLGFLRGSEENIGAAIFSYPSESLGRSVEDWVALGGIEEDFPPRFFNHFHDPLSDKGLLKENILMESAITWAQKPIGEQLQFDASWFAARNRYYEAVTSISQGTKDLYFHTRL